MHRIATPFTAAGRRLFDATELRGSARGDDVAIAEQSSCDPDSYYRDLAESGRLDEHFAR
jgi:hypothetical protein